MPDRVSKQPAASPSIRRVQNSPMIKDYRIVGIIGEGGMGKVYKAIHPTLKREIILKELKIKEKETRERFLREAKVMLDFRHENIVQVFDHFKEGNSTYIAMEYVKGMSLGDIIRLNKRIVTPMALFILYQASLGLYHAHAKKVIHRDIKPQNILISENGEVKLIDFGIATQKGMNHENSLTGPGTVIGTPAYMSPEQFSSTKEITFQSDIYSLGVVFYEMLTGIRPFKNEYSSEVLEAIAKGRYMPANKIVRNLPSIAKKILKKMFNPDIKKRYKTLLPLIHLLKKEFRKYNIYELRASVKCLLKNEQNLNHFPYYIKNRELRKRRNRKIFFVTVILCLALLAGCFFHSDRQFEWILRNHYGRVNLSFNRANLDPDSIFIKIDNTYKKASFKPGQDRYSKKIYLKKGYHELSISSGSYRVTQKIDLLPVSMQKMDSVTKKGMDVDIKIYNLTAKEVMLSFRFWDSLKPDHYLFQFDNYTVVNERLRKEEDNIAIWDESLNKNVNLKDYITKRLSFSGMPFYSNKDYAFLVSGFEKEGVKYADRRFKLKFGLDERTVVSHIPLVPIPATIRIISPYRTNRVQINGRKMGMLFQNGKYGTATYRSVRGRPHGKKLYLYEFQIPPGVYRFQLGNGRVIKTKLASEQIFELRAKKEKNNLVY